MIDNDMRIPANLIDTVKDAPADAGIVVPVFYLWIKRNRNWCCAGASKKEPEKLGVLGEFPAGFHELTKCGTGVIFIRPSVLRQMPYPYFKYLYNEDQGMAGTEDIQFCLKARELGIKIYGNTAVKVGHFHSIDLSTLWKWAESEYMVDSKSAQGADSETKDAESPSVRSAEIPISVT